MVGIRTCIDALSEANCTWCFTSCGTSAFLASEVLFAGIVASPAVGVALARIDTRPCTKRLRGVAVRFADTRFAAGIGWALFAANSAVLGVGLGVDTTAQTDGGCSIWAGGHALTCRTELALCADRVACATMEAVVLCIDASPFAERGAIWASTLSGGALESCCTGVSAGSAVQKVGLGVDATAQTDGGCGLWAGCDTLTCGAELTARAGFVASAAVLSVGLWIDASARTAQKSFGTIAYLVCAAFGFGARLVASTAVLGIAVCGDTKIAAACLCGWASPLTTAVVAKLARRACVVACAAVEGITIHRDTQSIACLLACRTNCDTLCSHTRRSKGAGFSTSSAMFALGLWIDAFGSAQQSGRRAYTTIVNTGKSTSTGRLWITEWAIARDHAAEEKSPQEQHNSPMSWMDGVFWRAGWLVWCVWGR